MKTRITKEALGLKVALEQQAGLLEDLLELMQGERELLVRFEPERLVQSNKRKELLVLQHSYIEQGRRRIIAELTGKLDLDDDPSLKEIARAIGGEIGHDLLELRNKISALVDAIGELNRINGHLIEHSIRSVNGSVAFLKRRFFNSEIYSSDGLINTEIDDLSSLHDRA